MQHDPPAPDTHDATAFDVPAAPFERALHASPLDAPLPPPETREQRHLARLILVNAAVVSAGIIAAALLVRDGRTKATGETLPLAVTPEPPVASIESAAQRSTSEPARVPYASTGAVTRTPPPPAADRSTAPAMERRSSLAARTHSAGAAARKLAARDGSEATRPSAKDAQTRVDRVDPPVTPPKRKRQFRRVPYQPSRAQVVAAMQRVTPAVYTCFDHGRGFAMVRIGVAGKTGRVQSARVLGQTGRQASCVARAVRQARFPRFLKQTLKIDYPFKR